MLGQFDVPPVVLAVVASTFFVGFGGGVVFPILPNLGAVLGISSVMVGVILSTNRWVRLVANAPAGALVDRYGTRKPFIYGLFIQAVATLGYVVALVLPEPAAFADLASGVAPIDLGSEQWQSLIGVAVAPETWFVLARVFWGLGSAAVFATAYTIAADSATADNRGLSMGIVRGGLLLGFPAGLVIGGVVSSLFGNVAAFGAAAAFAFVASAVAYWMVPETHVTGDPRSNVSPIAIDTSVPTLTVGLVNFGLMFAYIGALFSTLVLFLEAHTLTTLGLDAQGTSGLFMAGTVIAAGGAMLVGGQLSDRRNSRVPVLLTFLLLFAAGFGLLAVADSLLVLAVACVLIGAGQGGTSGPMMALLADLVPGSRMGRASGTNNVFGDVGGGLGPLVSLPLIEVVGFTPIYLVCALIPLVTSGILLVGVHKQTGTVFPGRTATEA